MKTAFLITARLKSSRLPKKVIKEVLGKPLIVHMIDRIKQATLIDQIILCTSTNPQDDPLETIATAESITCYRGSEDDVLVRLCEAATLFGVDYIVNVTADCPLTDPVLIDYIVQEYQDTHADLIELPGVPEGLIGVSVSAMQEVVSHKDESETEIWRNYFTEPGMFKVHLPDVDPQYKHPTIKLSLDYPEDYEFITQVYEKLYTPNKAFSLVDILQLVRDHEELLSINTHLWNACVDHRKTAAPVKWKSRPKT